MKYSSSFSGVKWVKNLRRLTKVNPTLIMIYMYFAICILALNGLRIYGYLSKVNPSLKAQCQYASQPSFKSVWKRPKMRPNRDPIRHRDTQIASHAQSDTVCFQSYFMDIQPHKDHAIELFYKCKEVIGTPSSLRIKT
jgi:hypothetical protein